ncbi:MAG TPA: hypothetical protein VIH69_05115, partial [Dehalococcoidia bacterium]
RPGSAPAGSGALGYYKVLAQLAALRPAAFRVLPENNIDFSGGSARFYEGIRNIFDQLPLLADGIPLPHFYRNNRHDDLPNT